MQAVALSKIGRVVAAVGMLGTGWAAEEARVSTVLAPEAGRLVIEAHGVPPPAPVFFSARAEQVLRVSPTEVLGEARVKLRIVQGKPEALVLGLSGDGEVTGVSGKGLRDWAVRQTAGQRRLELRPMGAPPELEVVVQTRVRQEAGKTSVPLVTAGEAVGFASEIELRPEAGVEMRVVGVSGLMSAGEGWRFFSGGDGRLEIAVASRGALPAGAELVGAQLSGRVNEAARSVAFRLRANLRAQKAGARVRVLSGAAALSEAAASEAWHVELRREEGGARYELVADREGVWPVELAFAAAVRERGDWRGVEFTMPAGAVVPLLLEGLGGGVSFKEDAAVVPGKVEAGWRGFLPADGTVALAWRQTREAGEAARSTGSGRALAFTSAEQTEVRIGAGLMRQTARVELRILQGKLGVVRLRAEGAGEIMGVEGDNVVGWKVLAGEGAAAARVIEVRLSRPIEAQGALVVQSQAELGTWPVRVEPLRVTPEGGVRHAGHVRVVSSGAVRLEVAEAAGLMQLAPEQWPGAAGESGARQVLVYRFPSANYAYRVLATQIQPEVGVSAVATYELGETVRAIQANVELDVREAALREFSFRIPESYAVVALSGSDVADYVAEAEVAGGYRTVRVVFGRAVEGRQLLQVRLEANLPAAAGEWVLAALQFPTAKAVRGHVGVLATPGFRIVPGSVSGLVEVPLNLFPRQVGGLQQAWRVRAANWTATVQVEALGQSVQADVFHLTTLKEGVAVSSVLLNYFVVGAPMNEWRVEVPAGVGNIDVVGQNVRRDWRREGEQIVVSLHQPVLGAATLLITFEQPMSARGGVIRPGAVRPVGVQAERGFVQVVSPLQVKHEVRRAEGALLKLEATELPAEFRTFTSAPALAMYHYTARPFALELAIEWYAAGETVDQVVDFAKLATQVSRDGQVVTEAQFFVKTRGRKALRLVLPAGVKLWEARVDKELVNARADGEQTLVPLPARVNPNEPVVVALRLGQPASGGGGRVKLSAPRAAEAPTVINEWTVRGDTGRMLVPHGGNAEAVRAPLTETGFEWIGSRAWVATLGVLGLAALAGWLLRGASSGVRVMAGLTVCALAAGAATLLAGKALLERRVNAREVTFAATVVPAGEAVTVELANVPEWRAMVVGWGVATAVAGAGMIVAAGRRRWRRGSEAWKVAGVMALAAGVLAQRGGAVGFFVVLGAGLLVRTFLPAVAEWRRERRGETMGPSGAGAHSTGSGPATAVTALVLAGLLGAIGGAGTLRAAPMAQVETEKTAEAIVQRWTIRGERLLGEAEVTVRGAVGESFLLLRAPAVLTEAAGEGLRVSKATRDESYYLVPEKTGVLTARIRFEMAVADRTKPIVLPTGPAAAQRVTVELDQGGWEVTSASAVRVEPTAGLEAERSGATLVLAPEPATAVQLRPKRRDTGAEATQFFVEAAQVFLPGPGVVNGIARVTVRPVQGRVSAVELEVPREFTVGEVGRGPVGAWRFDPGTRRLHVAVEPAQTGEFRFEVETQLGAGELPFALAVEPLRVRGAAGEVGMVALAFGGDAQSESLRVSEMSEVSVQDLDGGLVPRTKQGQPVATVQNVWRYGPSGGRVELKVAAVAPEVRVASRQVFSLDEDRLVVAADLRVTIARVGIFKLSFAVPERLDVEAVSGAALSQWAEAVEDGRRIVTLHLKGRTIGEQVFNLTLAGAAPGAADAWDLPRLVVREAARQTAEALVVPGKGIRLRALERERVTQLDPRTVGGMQPGTLAFRLLEKDWALRLGIELLEPWVTVQALQEVTVREGQTLTRIGARYRVENAAVKTVRVRLPGLSEEGAKTVRAIGAAVSDVVKVPAAEGAADDMWEVRFQRSVAGETEVQIEFQSVAARAGGAETVATAEFVGARQATLFVAVRAGGRLELAAGELPRGWTRVDWSAVPVTLQNRSDRSVPALCFRVAEPERALAVTVRRHEVAEALKLRATQADLLTLFAPTGPFLTAVELKVDVLEKGTLRVRLPAGARLFTTLVNGESVAAVRDGEAWLFHVTPQTAGERGAAVRLVYSAKLDAGRDVELLAPSLSVPLENVTWRVVLPPGYELDDYRGALRLRGERWGATYGVGDYQELVRAKRTSEAKEAVALLSAASSWLAKGEQEKASAALNRVSNQGVLDEASNEDARVQLRNLKTLQAVLGLNTRRQRMYLDNRADAARNDSLEQSANLNPFLQGNVNFDPRQVDQLLSGNSSDENAALRGIAAKIVDQQLGAQPTAAAIDVTLPERGKVYTFTRSLQVDGGAPLELRLEVERMAGAKWGWGALVLLGVGVVVAAAGRKNRGGRM